MELDALANPGVGWGKAVRLLPENAIKNLQEKTDFTNARVTELEDRMHKLRK